MLEYLLVLISTYWNVNLPRLSKTAVLVGVLISTYWNVNLSTPITCCFFIMSFNLNLLECKLVGIRLGSSINKVLISTYWNVNLRDSKLVSMLFFVLISTYWNVNY